MNEKLAEINEKASAIAARIKLLGSISWSRVDDHEFLRSLRQGRSLPKIEYAPVDYSDEIAALTQLRKSFIALEPAEIFTRETIDSYLKAAHLVHATDTLEFTRLSIETFGKPGNRIPGMSMTNVQAAERLIAIGRDFEHPYIAEPVHKITAEEIADELRRLISRSFGERGPVVVVVAGLAAKASATSDTIKLRAGAYYSKYDARQLFAHEVMTHALTAKNGLRQPVLKTMGRGAPRTTATQEGLATFSELVTGAIDLKRLMRLALRIVAIDRALGGADFRQVYEYFVEHGQSCEESYLATARIFRGGQPHKSIIFTKDAVYLDGLLRLHILFRWALANKRLGLVHLLFCGRLAIEDCFLLESALEDGLVLPPLLIPEWYENIEGLAGQLTFSLIAGSFQSHEVEAFFESACTVLPNSSAP